MKKRARYFAMIFGLLILANACGAPVSNSAVPPVSENRKIDIIPKKIDEDREFGADCHTNFETEFARIITKNTSPVMIASIVSVNGKKDFKEGVDIEIKNVSDNAIESLSVDVSPPPDCAENLNLALPAIAVSAIKPGEIVAKRLSPTDAAAYFTTRQCRDRLPNMSPKRLVEVNFVKFADGSTWTPGNNCLEDIVSAPTDSAARR